MTGAYVDAARKSFTAIVEQDERGRVWITIPFDPAAVWGRKPRHHVHGDINGTSFDGSLGVRGGKVHFPIAKALRDKAGVAPGDTVTVTLEPATERSDDVPRELAGRLADDQQAKDFFDGLSGFYRRQYASWVGAAKQPATRQRRADEVVTLLRNGQKSR